MCYKGYIGTIEYSEEDGVYFGKIENIKSLVSYESKDKEGLQIAFIEAVDDYITQFSELGLM